MILSRHLEGVFLFYGGESTKTVNHSLKVHKFSYLFVVE